MKSKDPAFLFYTDNFQSGTQFFTDEQVGKYIRLLCAQHLHGHLSEKQVLLICKSQDKDTDEILTKFKRDELGLFYNERLENEVNKRKKFTESRAINRLGKLKKEVKKTRKTHDNHVGNENEDGNKNKNGMPEKEKTADIPELPEFMNHARALCDKAQLNFDELSFSIESKYQTWVADGWKDGNGNKIKVWKTKLSNTLPHLKPIRKPKDTSTWS